MNRGKIRFDSKDEFDAWFKLYEGENILYHAFGEIEPCEYPCVMIYITALYIKNLVDHENI